MERSLVMPISFLLQQQDQEEVPDEVAENPPKGDDPVPEVEGERSPVPDLFPPSPPPPPSAKAPADTPGPFIYSATFSGACSFQFEGARCSYGCCLFIGYNTGITGPEVGPSRGHYRAQPCHAPTYHEPPRSPASAYTSR